RGCASAPNKVACTFHINTFTTTPTTADTVRASIDEVDNLNKLPITDAELNDSKNFLIGSFAGQRETPEALINDLWLIEYAGLPADYFQQSLKKIAQTNKDDVKQVAAEAIDPKQFIIVIVGDAKKIRDDL